MAGEGLRVDESDDGPPMVEAELEGVNMWLSCKILQDRPWDSDLVEQLAQRRAYFNRLPQRIGLGIADNTAIADFC